MVKPKKHIVLHILLSVFLLIIIAAIAFSIYLSHHYKQIISKRLPEMVMKGSDSVYHISFKDINVDIFSRHVTITDLQLWPDLKQAAYLRQQHRHTPSTLSTVSIALLEADGFAWKNIITKKTLDFENVTVHDLKWKMECTPRPQDSLFIKDKPTKPYIDRFSAAHVHFINPDVTYHYSGKKENFTCFMKGGKALLNGFAYNNDSKKDTSAFLYAKNGIVRFDDFIFLKPEGRYLIKTPDFDFISSPHSVTIKGVNIKHMTDSDPKTGAVKEIYDLSFPSTELVGFNWNRLIDRGTLAADKINADAPHICIYYIREHAKNDNRKGKYPNQLLLQVGLKTYFKEANINKGYFKYTELTKKKDEGVIEFTGIRGHFTNVTNLHHVIRLHKNCIIKLEGKYMNKSDVSATFDLSLADTTGRFKVDGYVRNLDGKDVSEQAAVFTLVKVTSFHLNQMNMHIEGDETYEKGDFTVLYQDLKVSLFKFDTKDREKKHGTLSFLGSGLLLYPSNPMPNKETRSVTTSFARDTTKGFIYLIWQNMFRAAKKTAMREKWIITLTDGPETSKGEQPKKGILKRLFGKKK